MRKTPASHRPKAIIGSCSAINIMAAAILAPTQASSNKTLNSELLTSHPRHLPVPLGRIIFQHCLLSRFEPQRFKKLKGNPSKYTFSIAQNHPLSPPQFLSVCVCLRSESANPREPACVSACDLYL